MLSKKIGLVYGCEESGGHKTINLCKIPKGKWVQSEFQLSPDYDVLSQNVPTGILPNTPPIPADRLLLAYHDWTMNLARVNDRYPVVGAMRKAYEINSATNGPAGYGGESHRYMVTSRTQGALKITPVSTACTSVSLV